MSERPFVDAHRRLPLIGQRYEFQTFGGETWEATLVDIHATRGGLQVRTKDPDREWITALPLGWRPALAAFGSGEGDTT